MFFPVLPTDEPAVHKATGIQTRAGPLVTRTQPNWPILCGTSQVLLFPVADLGVSHFISTLGDAKIRYPLPPRAFFLHHSCDAPVMLP